MKVSDLADPNYIRILERGEQRVSEAIVKGVVNINLEDVLTEMLSFPTAIMLVNIIGDNFLDRRYAMAESVRTFNLLKNEDELHIAKVAREEFDWKLYLVKKELDEQIFSYELAFSDYLRNASQFHEDKWKLVNRMMNNGYVHLTKMEMARLIQVEVEKRIYARASKHVNLHFPDQVQIRVERLKEILDENRSRFSEGEFPSEIIVEAFPPCIRKAFESMISGRRASHMERFALTSFLIEAGMNLDKIVKLFTSVTDFNEQLTRYQIEHIAGLRGSRIKYTPPMCATMQTHGVCQDPDSLCRRIKHPLAYYRRKVNEFKKDTDKEKTE